MTARNLLFAILLSAHCAVATSAQAQSTPTGSKTYAFSTLDYPGSAF